MNLQISISKDVFEVNTSSAMPAISKKLRLKKNLLFAHEEHLAFYNDITFNTKQPD